MRIKGLGGEELAALEEALRNGEGCTLALERFPRRLRADEVIPWFDAVETRNAELGRALRQHLPAEGREDEGPSVTAIIPTNRGTPIGLNALRDQDCRVEVLVLLNGENNAAGDRVLRVPWEGHGPTRQRGVTEARGDYILFTVDDALPRGGGCVRALVEALEEGDYDAVFGRQLPWPGSDPITRRRLRDWTPPGRGHFRMDRLDHVFALYRRSTLLEHPLPAVPIGEDLHWRQNRRIGYVPGAMVVHAHRRSPRSLYQRTRDLHVQHHLVGHPPQVPTLAALTAALPGAVLEGLRGGPREVPNQLAELLGQWRAARLSP